MGSEMKKDVKKAKIIIKFTLYGSFGDKINSWTGLECRSIS